MQLYRERQLSCSLVHQGQANQQERSYGLVEQVRLEERHSNHHSSLPEGTAFLLVHFQGHPLIRRQTMRVQIQGNIPVIVLIKG